VRSYTRNKTKKASDPQKREAAPAFLSVFDGRQCCGFVLKRGKLGFEAFQTCGCSLGFFLTTREAAAAIPVALSEGHMLLRLAFLERERRCSILENCGLARVHVFRKCLPMMYRYGWQGGKANSGMAFAWFVWDRSHRGPMTVDRISWER
jgi:hypothetical protein